MTGRRSASASAVLRVVLDEGAIARSTIARRTGLSAAAVTGHVAELMRRGFLIELPEVAGAVGRPHVPLELDTERFVVGGAHIAVDHLTVGLLDLRGKVLAQQEAPHHGAEPAVQVAQIAELLDDLLIGHAPERTPLGLGVATGGWVDEASGTVVEHGLLGWHGVPLRELLTEVTGLDVRVDGHSRALIHAERLLGQPRARSSVVQLFTGNVVDAAFATGDTVHHGPRSAAGAVAHLRVDDSEEPCRCGRSGCLEATVSERTVARKAVEAQIIEEPNFTDVLHLAATGNSGAIAIFHERARIIGQAAALLFDVLNPEILIVLDQSVRDVEGCLSTIRDEVSQRSWICQDAAKNVVASSFPGTELATAGGAVMLNVLYEDPLFTKLANAS
ncbi:ROK family transcriptional regulator [Amycolatopsis sp. BJA-103]|uniref:ROK family transcriptional regulator n=1 Tax=Amycolatopsis sp. BJA-103 TaxID=1911175 RepID=UPI000C762B89|nr:ROK family transcriptional regulator [Amycolatopsis sp. BJA-103]AUI57074.1 sugar kinase [Amycolatopsis sp. BJA-103]PNE15350.1 sugar kinase [Amycolatopsis sp. BJA-103]